MLATELFIEQDMARYSATDHDTWRHLYRRMIPLWEHYANQRFLDGLSTLRLNPTRIPALADVNRFLEPRTHFRAVAVAGYVPAYLFFDCLKRREFPTTITIRGEHQLDYLPEPDIFHDVCGHVPMHTDPAFAETLVRFGECARVAAQSASREMLVSRIRALARFFWFTVEFGLMRSCNGLRAYGSGLLSSYGELAHSIDSAEVQRSPLSLDWVIHQSFEIDHYQPLLFVVDSFDHLYGLVSELERWLEAGELDHVAPGEPAVSLEDLESFLHAQS